MVKCPACNQENLPGSLFCAKCGTHLPTGKRLSTDEVPEQELPVEQRSSFKIREPSRPKGPPLEANLVFIGQDNQEITLPQVTTLDLGRGQDPDDATPMLDLTLHGAYKGGVSRFHARIHRQSTGFYIEDLLSTNGTFINEQRIPPYVPQGLRDGDEIQLGRLALKFHIRSGVCPTPFPNPYIAGAPIKGERMFYGRDDVFEAIRARLVGQHQDNVVVIYGQRRTGKTSVLYQMGRRLNADGERYVAVLVDLQGLALEGMDNFLWELARTIRRALRRDYELDLSALDRTTFQADARGVFRDSFLPSIGAAIGERRLLLMFDEAVRFEEAVATGRLERGVFDYLRSLMQHEPGLSFIFSLGSKLEQMRQEYALMFNTALHLQVSFLDQQAARALVAGPVAGLYTFEDAAVERLLTFTSRHPYFTQLLCHALFTRWERERWPQIASAQVDAVLDEATSLAIANLQYIWNEADRTEKLVLSALAEISTGKADAGTLNRKLEQAGVHVERTEVTRALNSLARREVIDSPARPRFSVELVRRWLAQEKPLAWAREELREALPAVETKVIVEDLYRVGDRVGGVYLALPAIRGIIKAMQSYWPLVLGGTGLLILLILAVWRIPALIGPAEPTPTPTGTLAPTPVAGSTPTRPPTYTPSPTFPGASTTIPALTDTPTAWFTPEPTRPIPGFPDEFEPNHWFDHARLIGMDTEYRMNFVPWTGSDPDNDFFKLWVTAGQHYTCETLYLEPGTNTNMIFCDGPSWEQCFAGNDDASPFGFYNSRLTFLSNYDGYLYVIVRQVGAERILPEEWASLSYSLACHIDQPVTPTITPTGTFVAPTPQPSPTLFATSRSLLETPVPSPTPTSPGTPLAGTPTSSAPHRYADHFEFNNWFDHASLIGLGAEYNDLSLIPWTGSNPDYDFYKLWVTTDQRYVCETYNLSPATNTNVILCGGPSWEQCFAGNDDVLPFDPNDPYRSRLAFSADYKGYVYIVVRQVGVEQILPEEWESLSLLYGLSCYVDQPATPTATPSGTFVAPAAPPTATPWATARSLLETPVPSPTPTQPGAPPEGTPTPVGNYDVFEPNYGFDRAALIGLDARYSDLNFVPGPDADSDTDFFKLWVTAGNLYTCETFDLSPATNTNMIFCNGPSQEQCFAGNDDVDALDPYDAYRSRLAYLADYDGYLYIMIGQVGAEQILPHEWANLTYGLWCYVEPPVVPTHTPAPAPSGTLAPPTSTSPLTLFQE